MERLNISLPVKYSKAQGYWAVGQYLISILWWTQSSKTHTPMQDMLDCSLGEGKSRWSVSRPALSSYRTSSSSSFFSQMWSLRQIRMSMSPQRGLPRRQDPQTYSRQLSTLSTSLQKHLRTQTNMRLTLSLGIFVLSSSQYRSPIFWFLLSSSLFPLSYSIERIPFEQSSSALFGPTPQILLNSSITTLFSLCCMRSSFQSLPVLSSSLTFLMILQPTPLKFSRSHSDSISLSRLRMADTALRQAILRPMSFSFQYIFCSFMSSSQMNLFTEKDELLASPFWHRNASLFRGLFYPDVKFQRLELTLGCCRSEADLAQYLSSSSSSVSSSSFEASTLRQFQL